MFYTTDSERDAVGELRQGGSPMHPDGGGKITNAMAPPNLIYVINYLCLFHIFEL